jgi:hypothetical protein
VAGSNAGRGFRYQDLIGALFVTRMYLGEGGFDAITPEGSDDYEIEGASGVILVDTKSTRADARLRTESEDAASLRKLWARPLRLGLGVAEYWLVTERGRSDWRATDRESAQSLFGEYAPANSARSFILTEPYPMQVATELLAEHRGMTPIAAELVVIRFAHTVGEYASKNGALDLEERKAIKPSDAERIATRVLAAVDADRLEALLKSGFLSAVDFDTPLEDSGFYLGVDVQPGHFAAGLALRQPDEAARIVEALGRIGAVIIRGPSGAGKSGLMWNAVLAVSGARRWFRVNASIAAEPCALTAFFEAYVNVAIGFVVDDIGRGGVEAWSLLHARCRIHTRAVMIGSIRSEDASLLPNRHTIAEITIGVNQRLARALWMRLRERGQTTWPGWSEPWSQSQGLLLEYGHILTAKARLGAVILDQVRSRLEEHRDHELAILSSSVLPATYAGTVSISNLKVELNLSDGDMTRALERLIAEHLVRVDPPRGQLTGLHALRAASISSALTEVGYSVPSEQANAAIAVTDAASLEKVITGLIASGSISDSAAADAIASRLSGQVDIRDVAAAVRGLRAGLLTLAARDWLSTLPAAGIPRKLATAAAMMGWNDPVSTPDMGDMRKLVASGNRLVTTVTNQRFPASLAMTLIRALCEGSGHAGVTDLVDALSALSRAALTAQQRGEVAAVRLPLDNLSIGDVARILDAAESIDPGIASAWVSRAGPSDLLDRLFAETPFALPIRREEAGDGVVVHGDIYEAALQPGENPNERLVTHVNAIMRLEPRAVRAHVRLVDVSGTKSLHIDSEKRMPRANAPPSALGQSNRRVLDVVANEVGNESWSHYLFKGEKLLKRGLGALERLLDSVMVGRVNQQALDALNEVTTECDNLIAPARPPELDVVKPAVPSGRHLTPLQNVIFASNAKLVSRVAQLPDGANALAGYVEDLNNQADEAKREPWLLVRGGPPEELEGLQQTLRKIELVAIEAAASGISPRHRWRKPDGKPRDAFEFVARGSRTAFMQRTEARCATLLELIAAELPGTVLTGPTLSDGIMWRTRFVATFPISRYADFERWITEARAIGERLRAELNEREDVVLFPLLNGKAAVDYAYQLSRGNPDSIVAPILIAAGRTSMLSAPSQTVVNRLPVPAISHPIEVERFFTAVRDFAGMCQLGLGGPSRPTAERDHLDRAFATITEVGPRLIEIFHGVKHPAIDAIRAFVNLAMSGSQIEVVYPSISFDGLHDALALLTWQRAHAGDPILPGSIVL